MDINITTDTGGSFISKGNISKKQEEILGCLKSHFWNAVFHRLSVRFVML